ncbi:MAG: TRAP transporter substrate-binding protein DctP [Proteobacteria bacterium]|nr:TRAP transporter substrate-binding protein DctP [Pseudomonadota bacterium]
MNVRRCLVAIALTIVPALPILFSAPPAAAVETIKLTTCLPRTDGLVIAFMDVYMKPFAAAAKGVATIKYIGGPEVTPRTKQAAAVERGLMDMIFCPASYYSGNVLEAKLLPVGNVPVWDLRKNGAMDMLQEAWAKNLNARIISYCCNETPFHIYLTQPPKFLANGNIDLRGLKLRSTALYNAPFKALGATPITMAAPEIYTGLQRGVVSGFGWPETSVVALGVKDLVKYKIEPGFFRGTNVVIMNLKRYKALSAKARAIVDKVGEQFERDSIPYMDKLVADDVAKLKKAGMKIVTLSGPGKKAFQKTLYDAAWQDMKGRKYVVDFNKLKSLMYQ